MAIVRNKKQNTIWEITNKAHLKRLLADKENYEQIKEESSSNKKSKELDKPRHNPDNISKLTEPQRKMFEKINQDEINKKRYKDLPYKEKLTPKQKCDFYTRMSKILKNHLDELEILSCLSG